MQTQIATMDMKIELMIDIHRPVPEVFSYISNFSNHKHIFSANLDGMQLTDGPVGVGTRVKKVASFMGRRMEEFFEVTSFEQNSHIACNSVSGSTIPTNDVMSVEPLGDRGTLLNLTVYAQPKGFFKVLFPLVKWKVAKILSKDLKNLKRNLENKTAEWATA